MTVKSDAASQKIMALIHSLFDEGYTLEEIMEGLEHARSLLKMVKPK